MTIMINQPERCSFCKYYLTTDPQFVGYRCVDPGHWQAAGLLKPGDYYPLAQVAAIAIVEHKQRLISGDTPAFLLAKNLFTRLIERSTT